MILILSVDMTADRNSRWNSEVADSVKGCFPHTGGKPEGRKTDN